MWSLMSQGRSSSFMGLPRELFAAERKKSVANFHRMNHQLIVNMLGRLRTSVEYALANRGFESRRPDQFSANVLNVSHLRKRTR